MKTKTNTHRFIIGVAMAALTIFAASSCHKDSSPTTSTPVVTESEAAQVTTDAVTPSTGGMAGQVDAAAQLYSSASVSGGTVSSVNSSHMSLYSTLICGTLKDSTITYASVAGAVPSYTYSLEWQYTLACTIPSSLTLNFAGSGSYEGLILSSQFNSTGGFVLTGLAAGTADYTYTSTYGRQGTTTSKVGAKNTFTHNLTIKSKNILYDKATSEIASGTATVSLTCTSTSGQSWIYGGTLTFLGNKKATLVLNSGVVYNISWT